MVPRSLIVLSALCVVAVVWNTARLFSSWIADDDLQCMGQCADSIGASSIEAIPESLIEKDDDLIYFPNSDLNCSRIFIDSDYAREKQKAPLILDASVDALVDTSCEAIQQRVLKDFVEPSKSEREFPVAFARIVYKDYLLQELLFKLQYTRENRFCFVIDKKATPLFKEQVKNLTKCFPNAILARRQMDIDSAGHNMLNGFMDCLRLLLAQPKWNYAITLQNHDIPLRTNFELVSALKALNGSNDVSIMRAVPARVPKNQTWTYESLQLFKDESKNDNRTLEITKGSSSCSLSRAFVDFIVNQLNVSLMIDLFNKIHYGVDEMFFSTLHSSDTLDAPGGYTSQCIPRFNGFITRHAVWKTKEPCRSGIERHRVCVQGLSDLADLDKSRLLFVNKMMPELDYSAVSCWAQRLLQRSMAQDRNQPMKTTHYSNLAVVRFNRDKTTFRENISAFQC